MTTGLILFGSVAFFVVGIMSFTIALGLWTYKDAQVKSEQSPAIWVLVVLLVPNMLGLLIYLLVGRTKKDVPAPRNFLWLVIASLVLFIISIVVFVFGVTYAAMEDSGGFNTNSGVWSGQTTSFNHERWRVSVRRGNGTQSRNVTLAEHELQNFRVDSVNEQGYLTLTVTQNDITFQRDISGSVFYEFDLTEFGFVPGRVRLQLRFDSVHHSRTEISWRN